MKFTPHGPKRFTHQLQGLARLVKQKGRGALLFDPGTGKTATVIDYISLLAQHGGQEVTKVLVLCPLVARDTWLHQLGDYLPPSVDYWAEIIGGSGVEKIDAIASRGGRPYQKLADGKARLRPTRRQCDTALQMHKAIDLVTRPEYPRERLEELGIAAFSSPNPKVQLLVLNYDSFSSRRAIRHRRADEWMADAVQRYEPDLVICDESHKLKSPSSNTSRAVARAVKFTPRRILLTGTVMPHSPMDVYGQWRVLDPMEFGKVNNFGIKKPATWTGFMQRYAKLGGFQGKEIIGFQRLDELTQKMEKLAMVVKKEDALDLPKTTDTVVPVTMTAKEWKVYDDMRQNLVAKLEGDAFASAELRIIQMLRLRQITSGFIKDEEGNHRKVGSSKIDAIKSLVHDTLEAERRIVIFAEFRWEVAAITEALAQKGTQVWPVTGDTPPAQRVDIRKKFGDTGPGSVDRMVIVAQIKTLSVAVNELVSASHAIFTTPTQQRDDYIQARDRLNRVGQTRPVTYWHMQVPGSIDELVMHRLDTRTELESTLLNHIYKK
nr:MAG TPA: Chromatin remodeling complex ATPase [Caudoviricetes sp.]